VIDRDLNAAINLAQLAVAREAMVKQEPNTV
jgi:transposase